MYAVIRKPISVEAMDIGLLARGPESSAATSAIDGTIISSIIGNI
jgi:hypothetical protein